MRRPALLERNHGELLDPDAGMHSAIDRPKLLQTRILVERNGRDDLSARSAIR